MTTRLDIRFTVEDVAVQAVLFEEDAPQTCRAVLEALPLHGDAIHASYSGTIVALLFDPSIVAPIENATNAIQTGDLLYTHYDADWRHGFRDPVSEVYWAYDRYARPTIPGMFVPAPANVFGRILGDASAFYAVCRRIPREGWKPLSITRAAG